jgi:hypothetical protein
VVLKLNVGSSFSQACFRTEPEGVELTGVFLDIVLVMLDGIATLSGPCRPALFQGNALP